MTNKDIYTHPLPPSSLSLSFSSTPRSNLLLNNLPGLLLIHLKHNLMHLPLLEILIRLRRILQLHRLAAQESDLLLLLHEELEGGLEDRAYGAAAEGGGDIFAVHEEAVDFPFLGTATQVSRARAAVLPEEG